MAQILECEGKERAGMWLPLFRGQFSLRHRENRGLAALKGLLDYAIKIAATWVACKNRLTFYTTQPTPSNF